MNLLVFLKAILFKIIGLFSDKPKKAQTPIIIIVSNSNNVSVSVSPKE